MNSRVPRRTAQRSPYRRILVAGVGLFLGAQVAPGQTPVDTTPRLTISGFGQADFIVDFKRNDPLWFDVNRPSKLPSGPDVFGANGNTYVSARQSRFGALAHLPTRRGEMMAQFSFDMFGVGPDAGQTTIRLRHAWGKWHHFGGGLLESPFMDVDVFPNIVEYWGPNGMLFFRNAQIFWEPIDSGKANLRIALERPGASADISNFADRIELKNVKPHYPAPDLSAAYKYGGKWGYVRLSGMLRYIGWVQRPVDTLDLSGHVTGWGTSLSSNIKFPGEDVLRLQFTYGAGVQNYFNDAPIDVGAKFNLSNRRTPLTGEALPIAGGSAYIDHYWNPRVTSALGISWVNIDNSNAQPVNAYHNGEYASVNLLWVPVTNVLMGAEFQYGRRVNVADDWSFNDYRLQISFKYSFSKEFGGTP